MKSVTEFWSVVLVRGLAAKNALAAEGKSAEEIQAGLGEKFKMEGDKLKHFVNAIEVANQNQEKLSRVLVVSLNEGENPPAKAIKVEEHHYVPEFQLPPKAVNLEKAERGGGKGGGKKGGRDGGKVKTSPWGLTPEEKAAKGKGKGAAKPS